jgi:hypothetical protein
MQKNEVLDKLVVSGEIKSYSLETLEFEPGSGSRECDQLTIVLPSGKSVSIMSICSGHLENATFFIEDPDNEKL